MEGSNHFVYVKGLNLLKFFLNYEILHAPSGI